MLNNGYCNKNTYILYNTETLENSIAQFSSLACPDPWAEDHATIGPYIISYVVICSQGRQIWTYLVQRSTINTGYYQFWIKTSKQAGINLKDRIHNNKAAMALVFKVQMDDEYDKQEIE